MGDNKFKQTAFRLTPRALEILDEIQETEGLGNRTMTLEFLLRDYKKWIKHFKNRERD